ncbi:MAG TPA: polysaccharide deacetylase family protein [Gemmatimonadaceae bacterium]|jgi:peptidoglycan/xylan/chitin deacetylase (PgdA/CDA1 family)|nr:polysaccharide deacetylase family protein [Gemmatimonadaceae bacterium]
MSGESPLVAFTVDVEPDCPPYLTGFRGIEHGMPRLLDLLADERVPATFFTTGEVASRFPEVVARIVRDGHELASHGMTHRAFTTLEIGEARHEIEESATILRRSASVTSFRAPYLQFPPTYLPLLEQAGFTLDSSQAKYKAAYYRERATTSLARVPASVTSSVLRLPRVVRGAYLAALSNPVVLFVHPWEFVDLRKEQLRIDCRFRTGEAALDCVRTVLRGYKARGARFARMAELST